MIIEMKDVGQPPFEDANSGDSFSFEEFERIVGKCNEIRRAGNLNLNFNEILLIL